MLKNYLKTALRNLWRNRTFSLINVVGLSVGLAACMLIFLYAKDELSFDRFQKDADRTYHLVVESRRPDGSVSKGSSTGLMPGPNFKREIPEIEDFVRLQATDYTLRRGKDVFSQPAFFVDSNFFSFFSLPLAEGNPKTALNGPYSVVLSEDLAQKYFGKVRALGQTLELEVNDTFRPFTVTGVARNAPANSSVPVSMMLSIQDHPSQDDSWLNFFLNTFFRLKPGSDVRTVEGKMASVFASDAGAQIKEASDKYGFNEKIVYHLQPLLAMHLDTEYVPDNGLVNASNPMYSYILTAIALFILVIACINFINLTVARSLKRAREIGIRKVVGGQRRQLIAQFLGESFVLEFIAFLLGIGLVKAILPFFNTVSNKALAFSYLLDAQLVAGFAVIFVLTGLLAGFYPALVLSGFRPVESLYGRKQLGGRSYLAKGLVVLQFTLATFLIIAAGVVYAQFNYLTHADLGYNVTNVVQIKSFGMDKQKLAVLKSTLLAEPGIETVSMDQGGRWGTRAHVNGDQEIQFDMKHVDEDYLPLLQVPLVKGRNFSHELVSDSAQSVMVNETFVKNAGWKQPIGQIVDFFYNHKKFTVVGVFKDYHNISLNEKIPAMLFTMNPVYPFGDVYVRLKSGLPARPLAAIERAYKGLFPFVPYNATFKEENNRAQYEAEKKWKQIVTMGALITVFVSCIGLLGLATLTAEKRRKEIGIRKVLGASVRLIVTQLSADFVRLVLLAAVIACPVAWWATHHWLQNYPYRVGISPWLFLGSVCLVVLVALLTIGFQAVKAAVANPVKALRAE